MKTDNPVIEPFRQLPNMEDLLHMAVSIAKKNIADISRLSKLNIEAVSALSNLQWQQSFIFYLAELAQDYQKNFYNTIKFFLNTKTGKDSLGLFFKTAIDLGLDRELDSIVERTISFKNEQENLFIELFQAWMNNTPCSKCVDLYLEGASRRNTKINEAKEILIDLEADEHLALIKHISKQYRERFNLVLHKTPFDMHFVISSRLTPLPDAQQDNPTAADNQSNMSRLAAGRYQKTITFLNKSHSNYTKRGRAFLHEILEVALGEHGLKRDVIYTIADDILNPEQLETLRKLE